MSKHYVSINIGPMNTLEQQCIRRLHDLVKEPDTHTLLAFSPSLVGREDDHLVPGIHCSRKFSMCKYPEENPSCQISLTRFRELWDRCRETIAKDYFGRPYVNHCMTTFLRLFVCWQDPDAFYVDNDVYFKSLPKDALYEAGAPYFGGHKDGMANHHVIYSNGRTDFFENMLVMFDATGGFIRQASPCRYLSDPLVKKQVGIIPHSYFYHKGSTFS